MRSLAWGSFTIALALSGLAGLAGCRKDGGAAPSTAGPAASASASAAASASAVPVSPLPSPARSATLEKLRGTWMVKLSPKQERDLETMRLVFDDREPPAERLAALSADERSTILAVREARKKAPNDPQYREMQAVLGGMGRSTLVVHTSSLTLSVGAVKQTARFTVRTETSTSVTLDATTPAGKSEAVVLGIVGPDELTMSKPTQSEALVFRRDR